MDYYAAIRMMLLKLFNGVETLAKYLAKIKYVIKVCKTDD